jgi:outer membrane protein assembly factor BamB
MCFRAADGKFLWQHVNDKLEDPETHDWPFFGICSTPFVEGDRLWYVTNRCEVVCLDVEGFTNGNQGVQDEPYQEATDADVIWRFDMRKELGVRPFRMSASSPLVIGDLVYVVTGNGIDPETGTAAAPEAPSFIALDKKTGRLVWKDASPGKNILQGQWSSPAHGIIDGQPQVIFAGGDGVIRGFDPKTGRRLWDFACNPANTPPNRLNHIVAAPVIHNGRVFVGTGQNPEFADGPGTFWSISFAKGKPAREWMHDSTNSERGDWETGRTVSSCAVHDGMVYAAQLNGFLKVIAADSGQLRQEFDVKASIWSSPLCADGKIYLGTLDGDMLVFSQVSASGPKEKIKLLHKVEMGAPICATPVAVGNSLYILTETHLFAIRTEK